MMLSDLSIRRPVLAAVISLLLYIAFGSVAFERLPLREYPDIDPPIVTIETTYRGASAAVVETRITQPIEDRIAGIAGLDSGKVDLYLDDVQGAKGGARHPAYREEQGVAAMRKPEFTVRAVLNRGRAEAIVWTCDFSFDYDKINAEYRT